VRLNDQKNQAVREEKLEIFPKFLLKILPVVLAVGGATSCQNPSVSAHESPQSVPVVAPAGSVLRVRLDQTLDTKRSRPGDRFTGSLDSPVVAGGHIVLPKGTMTEGHVVGSHPSSQSKGQAVLSLALDSCQLHGKTFSLQTDAVARVSRRHQDRNWTVIGGGSGSGTQVEGSYAGPTGVNQQGGTASARTPEAALFGSNLAGKKQVSMPAESLVGFTLKTSLAIDSTD